MWRSASATRQPRPTTSGATGFTVWSQANTWWRSKAAAFPSRACNGPGFVCRSPSSELMAFLTTFHPSTLDESSAQRIQLTPGRDAVSIDIAAVRARRLRVSGLVLDSHGVPVPSANGAFSRAGGLTATSHGFTADAAGRFAVAAVEPGEYTLVVGGGSWSTPIASTGRPETAELPMTIATDADDIVVVTQPGISLSGRVVLSDAAPASAPRTADCVPPRRHFSDAQPGPRGHRRRGSAVSGRRSVRPEAGARVRVVRVAGRSRPSC